MKSADYKAIDFFCGGGGMTYGLHQAGINVIAGVDFDKDAKTLMKLIILARNLFYRISKDLEVITLKRI